ncbi:hypothetical protein ACR3K2_19450 [Cryptosporidium serpentis]
MTAAAITTGLGFLLRELSSIPAVEQLRDQVVSDIDNQANKLFIYSNNRKKISTGTFIGISLISTVFISAGIYYYYYILKPRRARNAKFSEKLSGLVNIFQK